MAQAADSAIGFYSAAKAPDLTVAPPDDGFLAELDAWQASPAGIAAAQVFSIGSIIAGLCQLAATPSGLGLLAGELAALELAAAEIDQLLSRINNGREVAP